MEGKQKFWRILPQTVPDSPRKHQDAVLLTLGVSPTSWKIHASLYDHEKACADVFVSLAITDTLMEWQGEGDQKSGFRHDRMFRIGESVNYLEMEMGNHERQTLRLKVDQYTNLFRKAQVPFNVIFSFPTEQDIEKIVAVFEEAKVGQQYAAVLQSELVSDPLNARVTHRFDTVSLSNYAS